jgi:hypothetical protein
MHVAGHACPARAVVAVDLSAFARVLASFEDLLDEEDIDDADRVVISDNLRRLHEERALTEKEQRVLWDG